ncbi:ZIP family metal transporter [Halococcoides cellulosivorans]|uniref:ZIP family metal transporter n=1 Tax=Halococcoides cellulosivorans TaxID=1679096 RepID=A0A2R4X0E2_9EURY|nr:ZIP family metal transporter [Halococcoides cellulosivorans]AWB27264.1 ZIP family metal transporter [Halococcoides cellulosivorans]
MTSPSRQPFVIGIGTTIALVAVLGVGLLNDRTTLVGVTLFAFVAMAAGVALRVAGDFGSPTRTVWAYGLSSGAMLASAMALLAPKAIGQHAEIGGFAIAVGYLVGYAAHEIGHHATHRDWPIDLVTGELTLHAVAAGAMMGVLYGSLPGLTALFGFGVVAHKFPAGFTGASAVIDRGQSSIQLVVPAAAVALAAIPASLLVPPLSGGVQAAFFGLSTGVFTHVAIDMLPECKSGDPESGHGAVVCSPDADRLRHAAVASTLFGTAAIAGLWVAVGGL